MPTDRSTGPGVDDPDATFDEVPESGDGNPDRADDGEGFAAATEFTVRGNVRGQPLVIKGRLDRPCASVSVRVGGDVVGSTRPGADGSFEVSVDSLAVGLGTHAASVVCGDDGEELAIQEFTVVQPTSSATGAGSALGIVAFLMLGLLAMVSLPGPINQDD